MRKFRLVLTSVTLLIALALVSGVMAAGETFTRISLPSQPSQKQDLPDGDGPWVVRAYFTNREMVDRLAVEMEPWEVHHDKGYLVVLVDPVQFQWLLALGFRVEIDQDQTDEFDHPALLLPGQVNGIPGYPCYRTVEETYASAQDLAAAYPNLADWSDIGDSWEKTSPGGEPGYDLIVLRLTNSLVPGPKPKLFIMASIHAREYSPAELATRYAEYLLENYNLDADITWLLDYHEIHLLLHSNPDGRKKAETGLLWRKNTNNNYCSGTNSRGADLNRNFEFQWNCCGGSSGDPCAETYRGPSPASEPETQAVQNYVRSQFPDQRPDPLTSPAPPDATGVFLDIHSYGRLVLWPWGFNDSLAPNASALQTLGRKFAFFNGYTPEQSVELYPTDGATDDFAYGELGVAAYTFELGTAFFQNCSSFEGTIFPEHIPVLTYAAKAARTPYLTPAGPDTRSPGAMPAGVGPGESIQLSAMIDDTRFSNSSGSEPTQNIIAAEYYIDIPPWATSTTPIAYPMTASDGSFNAPIEPVSAALNTTGLSHGRHTIFLHGQDANGNWGAVSAVFIYILDPAVSPTIQGYVREADSNLPLAATVSAGIFQTASDPVTGFYDLLVVSGTYQLTASAPEHTASNVSNIQIEDYQTLQQDFYLDPICALFSDDVEAGNLGWMAATPWAITDESSHSPTHSWTESPGGNYANNREVSLTSPVLNLSTVSDVELVFWHTYATEVDYDFAYVEYSVNGGPWTGAATYDGTLSQWTQVTLALPALNGQTNARIRFRFTSDGSITANGWHLDDIAIRGSGPACVTQAAPIAEFTSNSPVVLGQPLQFVNLTSGTPPVEYQWDFGDGGGASTTIHPAYLYNAIGTYSVTLAATNTLGTDTVTHRVQVEPCISLSSITLTQVTTGTLYTGDPVDLSLDLAPNSAHKPYTYTLSFGDGSPMITATSSADPLVQSHPFETIGDHTVQVTAWNLCMAAPITDTIHVSIAERHGSTILPDPSIKFGDPGEIVTHTLRLTNIGDTPDTYTLTLGAAIWDTVLSTSTLTLNPGSAADFNVVVQVPVTAASGDEDQVQLSAASNYPATPTTQVGLTTSAAAVYAVHAIAVPQQQTGFPGDTLPYTLIIQNMGNATDTFDIRVDSSTWQTLPAQPSTTLFSSETGLVGVNVTIPAHASGENASAFLSITSQGDAGIQSSVVIITQASYRVFLPAITK